MMRAYKLTEEIARWAFEIKCSQSPDWEIAFTNPTAGPWKTIKSRAADGSIGEVYRFASVENRPDIIIINDKLRLVIIFEAKDTLEGLISGTQAEKSVKVVADLTRTLKTMKDNKYWSDRHSYDYYTGILWGTTSTSDQMTMHNVFDEYHNSVEEYNILARETIIGVESSKSATGEISCRLIFKSYDAIGSMTENQKEIIAQSLGLPRSNLL